MEEIKIQTEKVDDVPLILHMISEMRIGPIIDEIIKPHGNREGLSVGTMIMIWLSYILSQSDHRMSEVEQWVASQIIMLNAKNLSSRSNRGKRFCR
ncbi:MAG: transposase IS4 family [bacterium]|nr:MAG: transposase IS4 family [bacterium]